jgi:hypothetical protein
VFSEVRAATVRGPEGRGAQGRRSATPKQLPNYPRGIRPRGRSVSSHRLRLPAKAFSERGEAAMLETPRWLVLLFWGTAAALLIASVIYFVASGSPEEFRTGER